MTDLKKRLNQEVSGRADMNPEILPPPAKEEEVVEDYKAFVTERKDQLALAKLVRDQRDLGDQEKEIKKQRETLSNRIKTICGKYKLGKADCNGLRINYLLTERWTIDEKELLANGVLPKTIAQSKKLKTSYQLRITEPGEKDE